LLAEIADLARRFEGSFIKISPSEVSTVLQELSPSILAWDATDMTDTDWLAMDILRNHPRLARLPLILYGNIAPEGNSSSFTNILLKPLSGQTLSTILTALRPQKAQGAVLIVDDDHDSLDLYQQLVTAALPGHSIYRAETGQMALDILQDLTPSLVILDVFMPEIDGIRIVDWLRANPVTQHVPILVISGKTLTAEHIKHLDHPRLIYQPKDILKFEEVTDTLKQVASGTTLLSQYNSILVKRAVNFLQDNYARLVTLPEIAQAVGTSKNNLSEIFHQEMRISIWQFLNRYRIKQARHLLETSDLSVAAIATMVGFEDPAYFSRVFHSITNQSPKAYRLDFSHRN
jgi:AraC-like DNA-binding protein